MRWCPGLRAYSQHLRLANELDVAPVLYVGHLRDAVALRDRRSGFQPLACILVQGLRAHRPNMTWSVDLLMPAA